MSERQDDSSLDALIDEVARSLTDGPAPGNLRARVLSRIRVADDHGSKAGWRVPGIALASACLAAVAIYVGSGFIPSKNAPPDEVSGLSRTTPDAVPGLTGTTTDVASGLSQAHPDAVSGSTRTMDTRPGATAGSDGASQSEPPAGFESIAGSPLTIDPVDDSRLISIDLMSVEAIPIESLELGALDAQ